ncbi:MAG: hypothetical protein ACOX7F_05530 [Eubacteriales bacterium]|jgi:hypothetical protein
MEFNERELARQEEAIALVNDKRPPARSAARASKQAQQQQAIRKKRTVAIGMGVFLILYVAKLFFEGLAYQPVYQDFARFNVGVYQQEVLNTGLLSGICNSVLWTSLWDKLHIASFALSAMYFVAIALLYQVFSRHFKVTFVFLAVAMLSPLMIPGVYYMSAAVSIVPPLFFMALSVWCLQRVADTKSLLCMALFFIFQVLSFCFCKQVACLSAVLALMVTWYNSREINWGSVLVTILDGALVAAVYYLIARFDGVQMLDIGRFTGSFGDIVKEIWQVLFHVGNGLIWQDIGSGFSMLAKESIAYLPLLMILAGGAAALAFLMQDGVSHAPVLKKVEEGIWCVLVTIAPLVPMFFLAGARFSLASAATCTVGAALLINLVYREIFGFSAVTRLVGSGVCGVLIFLLSVGSIYEIGLYNEAGALDDQLVEEVYQEVRQTDGSQQILLFNTQSYLGEGYQWQEHILRVSCDEQTMQDALVARNGSTNVGKLTLVSEEEIQSGRAFAAEEFRRYDILLGLVDGHVVRLQLQESETGYNLLDESGKVMWSGEPQAVQT